MVAKKKTAAPEQGDLADAMANMGKYEDQQLPSTEQRHPEVTETQIPGEPGPAPDNAKLEDQQPVQTKAKGWGKKAKPAAAPTGAADETVNLSNVKKSLLSGVERVERLVEERQTINDDIKEVFAELRAAGYNTKIIREVMKRRGWGAEAIKEHDSLIDLYEEALR